MKIMYKLSKVMFVICSIVAAIALTMNLSGAVLEYVPYVKNVVVFSGPVFWRSLIAMFWWWLIGIVFGRFAKKNNDIDTI